MLKVARFVALGEGLTPADADDVASLAVLDYLQVVATVEHPIGWIRVVARRKSWDLKRKEIVRGKNENPKGYPSESICRPFQHVESMIDLEAALHALPDTERRALVAKLVEGEELESIAKSVGFSLSTLKRRLDHCQSSVSRALSGRTIRRYDRMMADERSARL